MTFEIHPLSDALGAEIIGLDVGMPLDPETFSKVRYFHAITQFLFPTSARS